MASWLPPACRSARQRRARAVKKLRPLCVPRRPDRRDRAPVRGAAHHPRDHELPATTRSTGSRPASRSTTSACCSPTPSTGRWPRTRSSWPRRRCSSSCSSPSRCRTSSPSRPAAGSCRMLLLLVLVDELNPIVRIYAWRMLLGREGVINDFLDVDRARSTTRSTGCCSPSSRSILVLSTSWVNYCALPIYASMKAINPEPLRGGHRSGRRVVHALAPHPHPAGGAGHLRGRDPRLHPAVHRLRHAGSRRRHVVVHARQLGRRPHGDDRRLGRRRRAQPAAARRRWR